MKKETIALAPGRFSPAQLAHIYNQLWALKKFDRLIIGIASCYEVGLPRHPLLAFIREKMMALSLLEKGVDMSRVRFIHFQDFGDWEQWWNHITTFPGADQVTHFITGNQEEVLGEIKKRNLKLPFELVNPEELDLGDYNFPFHSTDLREAIARNDYEKFDEIAAFGTKVLMASAGGFAGIKQALENRAVKFMVGRQTVDIVLTCRDGQKKYVLCGYRDKSKIDFPGCLALPGGAIEEYENPMDAAIRELKEETALEVEIVNRFLEPAHVKICGIITELKFVGLFSTENKKLRGSQGGSSQVFHIDLEASPYDLKKFIKSGSDLEDVGFRWTRLVKRNLAFQHNKMLEKALKITS